MCRGTSFVLLALVGAAVANGKTFRGSNTLYSGMQPEVVARTLQQVEMKWQAEAYSFVKCNPAEADCSGTPDAFSQSCSTVISAIVQGSSGDKRDVMEYMDVVCNQKIQGMHQQHCMNLKKALGQSMAADSYQNRNSFNPTKLCTSFWSEFVKEEKVRFTKEEEDRIAAEKKAAEEAVEEAAQKKVEEASRVKAEAQAKAKEAADKLAAKKAEAAELAKKAADKLEEAAEAEREHKKATDAVKHQEKEREEKEAKDAKDKSEKKEAVPKPAAPAPVDAKAPAKAEAAPTKAAAPVVEVKAKTVALPAKVEAAPVVKAPAVAKAPETAKPVKVEAAKKEAKAVAKPA